MTARGRAGRRSTMALLGVLTVVSLFAGACTASAEDPFSSAISDEGDDAGADLEARDPDPTCSRVGPEKSVAALDPLPSPGAMPAGSYMARIADRGALRAGVSQSSFKFAYLDQGGEPEGFDIDIARLVAEAIFGDPDRIELVATSSPERITKLQGDIGSDTGGPEVDIVVQTMTITCGRWAFVNFSTVYYNAGQRILVREGSPYAEIEDVAAAGVPACAVRNSTSAANLGAVGVDVVEVESWTDCLRKFQQGELEVISTDDTLLAGLAAQDPLAEVNGRLFSEEPYGIATPQDDQFTGFVNGVLEAARADGTWQTIYDRWLADSLGRQTPPVAQYR